MRIWFVIACLALPLCAPAQDKPASSSQPEIQAPRPQTNSPINTNLLAAPVQKPKDSAVKYSGVAADFKRSTNRWKFFSLRAPRDPNHDGENLIHDAHSPGGPVKVISIDF